jgi:hypothetical protein
VNRRRRRKEELLRWCTPLKAARGGGRWRRERLAETAGGNGGYEAMGVGKAVAATVRRCSARPGRLCSDREIDGWAPHGFDFFPIYPKLAQL